MSELRCKKCEGLITEPEIRTFERARDAQAKRIKDPNAANKYRELKPVFCALCVTGLIYGAK